MMIITFVSEAVVVAFAFVNVIGYCVRDSHSTVRAAYQTPHT